MNSNQALKWVLATEARSRAFETFRKKNSAIYLGCVYAIISLILTRDK
jgi:hypothetical protein